VNVINKLESLLTPLLPIPRRWSILLRCTIYVAVHNTLSMLQCTIPLSMLQCTMDMLRCTTPRLCCNAQHGHLMITLCTAICTEQAPTLWPTD